MTTTAGKTIGPVQDVRNNLARMKRQAGEPAEDFANRLYSMQMEIYSAWAGRDLWVPFFTLPKKVQEGWIKRAENQK